MGAQEDIEQVLTLLICHYALLATNIQPLRYIMARQAASIC